MPKYYRVRVKILWGMVFLLFLSILGNGIQLYGQKEYTSEESGSPVSYEYKKMELGRSKVKDQADCYLCGDNERSLMGMYRNYDDLGIVSVNHWYVEDLRIRNRDDRGNLTGPSGSVNITYSGTGEGGDFFYCSPMGDRGISKVRVSYGEDSILDGALAGELLCQECLDKLEEITETCVPEGESPKARDLFLVDFRHWNCIPCRISTPDI